MTCNSRVTRKIIATSAVAVMSIGIVACSDDDGDPNDIDNPVDDVVDSVG